MALTDKMDSVFDSSKESELNFDAMFDEDDRLIDIAEGFDATGKPLSGDEFEDIHLSDDEDSPKPDSTKDLDDNVTPDDIRKTLADKDDSFGASKSDIEDGSEQKIGDNTKDIDIHDKEAADQALFKDSDKKYQDDNFSRGTVDPQNINKSLEAERATREAALINFLDEADDFDKEATTDVTDEKPKDSLDIEEEDDADSRKDDDAIGDGVGELKEEADAADQSEEECGGSCSGKGKAADGTVAEKQGEPDTFLLGEADEAPENTEPNGSNSSNDSADGAEEAPKDEAAMIAFFDEAVSDGMLADDDEADVHSDVQCDGSANCQCPACKEKRVSVDSELAVGDTFKEDADLAYDSSDEDLIDMALNGDDTEIADLSYDPSDEDLIDAAIGNN